LRRFRELTICSVAALGLLGCMEPQIEAANERGVVLNYANRTNEAAAFKIADSYCREHGRVAQTTGTNFAYNHLAFACVAP
jgi:hypothetical protein